METITKQLQMYHDDGYDNIVASFTIENNNIQCFTVLSVNGQEWDSDNEGEFERMMIEDWVSNVTIEELL